MRLASVSICGLIMKFEEKAFGQMYTYILTFNSCTRCVGSASPGIIHGRMSGHGCGLTNERSIYLQATWVINVLGLYFDILYSGCLYNQTPTDVRSTGTGIKCLHCMYRYA